VSNLPLFAPDFSLPDTNNDVFALSSFRARCNVVLVLNRGFACPFCRQHLTELRREIERFTERQTLVVAIAPEQPDVVRAYWRREELPFVGLADPEHRVAALYRQEVNLFHSGRLPAIIFIDRSGKIRKTHYGSSNADIPTVENTLAVLTEINTAVR
jgi:peroxiredoxin